MPDNLEKTALAFNQSGRRCWTTTFTVNELIQLMPPRPPEQLSLFTETNRPISSSHLNALSRYIRDTTDWALPPLVLSAPTGSIKTKEETISATPSDLTILDGQHRLQAFADLITSLEVSVAQEPESPAAHTLTDLKAQQLSITVIEVDDATQHRQIWAWFARTRPIDSATREYFDNSDPYSKAAKMAMQQSAVLADRVLYTAASLPTRGPNSRKILSLRNLKDLAAIIHVGITKAPRAADRDAAWLPETQDNLLESLTQFFDTFLPSCVPNYSVLNEAQSLETKIASHRSQNWGLHPQTLRLFANCWARWTNDRRQDQSTLAPVIGNLNLQPADPGNDMQNSLALISGPRLRFDKTRSPAWETATKTILSLATPLAQKGAY